MWTTKTLKKQHKTLKTKFLLLNWSKKGTNRRKVQATRVGRGFFLFFEKQRFCFLFFVFFEQLPFCYFGFPFVFSPSSPLQKKKGGNSSHSGPKLLFLILDKRPSRGSYCGAGPKLHRQCGRVRRGSLPRPHSVIS